MTESRDIAIREVEEVLFEHEDVSEAVVVPGGGEVVRAFVVRRPGSDVSEDALVGFCQERLAAHRVPKSVEFRDELPKSAVGKVLRRALVDEERSGRGDAS